jgi:hypothetical protein
MQRRHTGFIKVRCCDEIPDQSQICYCGHDGRAYGHPERFTISEAVVEAMLDGEGNDGDDIEYV